MKEESFNEYCSLRCTAQEVITKSEDSIEQKIITIARGLLGISVAISPFQEKYDGFPLWLMLGWIFLCLSIIGNFSSILVAKQQATKILDNVDDFLQKDIEYDHKIMYEIVCHKNRYTNLWNIISIIFLFFGIVCILFSIIFN